MIDGPARFTPAFTIESGALCFASSSLKIICWMMLQPLPPYSTGHDGVSHPFDPSLRANSFSKSSRPPSASACCPQSGGNSWRMNSITSLRNASSSSVQPKSTGSALEGRARQARRHC